MSTTATTTKVWFKLFLGRKELKPFKVTLNQNDDIADLMEAVKSTCENSLQGVSLAQLRMYPPGTKVPISEEDDDASLDPGDLVDDLNGGSSSKDAFVIVAPDIGMFSDLMGSCPLLYGIVFRIGHIILTFDHIVSSIPYILVTIGKDQRRANCQKLKI